MVMEPEAAGRLLREQVDASASGVRHARGRARLVEAATAGATSGARSGRRVATAVAGLALASAMAVALVLLLGREPALSGVAFVVGPEGREGELGAYYAAPGQRTLPIDFADGSGLVVKPGGSLRVTQASRRETTVLLEGGTAEVHVARRPRRVWLLAAGPYSVRVVGTRFEVAWNKATSTLEVQMRSGKVVVAGPGIESGVEVSGTERFVSRAHAEVDAGALGASADAEGERAPDVEELVEEPVPIEDEPSPAGATARVVAEEPPGAATGADEPEGVEAESWSQLAARGAYDAILGEAEQRGLESVLQAGSADELSAVADAARFRGRPELSRRALGALRARFAGSGAARSAAFVLGRLEAERGKPGEALSWYDRYLAEGGPLVPEALGRRMVILGQLGRKAEAGAAAREYLGRYPDGPYAAHARDLVSDQAP